MKKVQTFLIVFFAAAWMFVHLPGKNYSQVVKGGLSIEAIAEPDTICLGVSSQLNVILFGGIPPYTYLWTPSTFLSDSSIANPVTSPTTTIKYHISVTDSVGDNAADSVVVFVTTPPPFPGEIDGPDEVCVGSVTTYHIDPMTGATSYSWTVPEDASIVMGQNSSTIDVLWGNTSGIVSVIVGNDCGNSPPSTLEINVSEPLPAPGAILGPETGCTGQESTFRILEVPDAVSYTWTIPNDAIWVSGQGTIEIIVIWGESSGDISVVANNVCGSSPPSYRTLTAGSLPGDAGEITGNDTVCMNHTGYLYSIPEIPDATAYIWSLPEGATIASGYGTAKITLDFSQTASSGNISVYGANDCGNGTPSSKPITVSSCAGINEPGFQANVTIYPNPTETTIHVIICGRETLLQLEIFDLTGSVRYSERLTAIPPDYMKKLDVSHFHEGLYIVKLSNEQHYFLTKFIVQR